MKTAPACRRNTFIEEISEKTGKLPKETARDRAFRFYNELVHSQRVIDFLTNNPELVYTQIAGKRSAALAGFPDGIPNSPKQKYIRKRVSALNNLTRRISADSFMHNYGFYLIYAFTKYPELFSDIPAKIWYQAALSPFVLKEWKKPSNHF